MDLVPFHQAERPERVAPGRARFGRIYETISRYDDDFEADLRRQSGDREACRRHCAFRNSAVSDDGRVGDPGGAVRKGGAPSDGAAKKGGLQMQPECTGSGDLALDARLASATMRRRQLEMQHVPLSTSRPPLLIRQSQGEDYGDSYQKECINSWREAGFRIVSVNPDCEIDNLLGRAYDIEFISNGSLRDRTKIEAFLSAIRDSGEDVAGIINADCFLMNPGSAIGNILKAAEGSILLLERLDIDPTTMRATGSYYPGFDAFFFDTRFVAKIDGGDDWMIGQPVWDYWFPLVMHIAGASLKAANTPIIVHLNHERQWLGADSEASGAKLFRYLVSLESDGKLPVDLAQQVHKFNVKLRAGQIDVGTAWVECVIPWLKTFPERFSLCPSGSSGDFVCRILGGMADSNEFRLEHQLNTVTFALWLQATRRAVARVRNGTRRRLQSIFLRTARK